MQLPKELKDAISTLPSKEKDKLIFRLLKKDLVLANRLLFELVSDKTIEDQRKKVKKQLDFLIIRATEHFYSLGYLNMDIRDMSGVINEHVSITRDKFGEAYLNLYILNKVLEKNKENILSKSESSTKSTVKFYTAVIARVFKVLILIKKLHGDYFMEFRDDLETLGSQIGSIPKLMDAAIYNGLDVNWLIFGNIPDEIEQIHKNLRLNGFLK